MKKKKYMSLTAALIPLLALNFSAMPVFADVGEYQEVDASQEETSAECQVIYKGKYDFSEEIPKYPELGVAASGYEGIYDGKPHGISIDHKTDGARVLYSTDGKTFTDKKPVYTDAGTYVTYYRVEKEGYTTVTGSATVKIKEAMIEFDADDCNTFYDGKEHSIDLSVITDDCKILYSEDGINFTSKKPEYKEPGTYVVYYKIMRDNYATVTGSSTVTIKEKDSTVNSNNLKGNNQNNSNQDNRSQYSGSQSNRSENGNTNDKISNVQTGDESHILLYAAMFIASIFGIVKNKNGKEKKKI